MKTIISFILVLLQLLGTIFGTIGKTGRTMQDTFTASEVTVEMDMKEFERDEANDLYILNHEIETLSGTISGDPHKVSGIHLEVSDPLGNTISSVIIAPQTHWAADHFSFIPGRNLLTVTAKLKNGTNAAMSFNVLSTCFVNRSGVLIDMITDSDGDGLSDYVESRNGTDPLSSDTDSDGLDDCFEITFLGTSAVKKDSNESGLSDFDFDYDGDGVPNGTEMECGTDPLLPDTDGDLLTDADEMRLYHTDPAAPDTDEDGASDGWEIINGYDPLTRDDAFLVFAGDETVTKDSPVAASVTTTLPGVSAESLSVKAVNVSEEPLLSPEIPGYLGNAYSFTANCKITEAEIVFRYDPSLGEISESFAPRIYYFNESTQFLEELPEQQVENGRVSVKVQHFSKYILLNKIEFDKVWEEEIRPPAGESDTRKPMDIVFVIDFSQSMDENDPLYLRKDVIGNFIDKLQNGDRAAVVKFAKKAYVLAGLTNDKSKLHAAVNGIQNDSGYTYISGTNGTAGIGAALNILQASATEHKYVIFLTDGNDTHFEKTYGQTIDLCRQNLIAKAAAEGISIYSIGLCGDGVFDASVLEAYAAGTGGKYYLAEEADALSGIYTSIELETVDFTTDSNGDGIPDYYNDLIRDGTLKLGNGSAHFLGVDFNLRGDDYDGDGLKNGEELTIIGDGKYVFLRMKSNPLMKHSDSDGVDDYEEVRQGTDPLQYQANASDLDFLCDDHNYAYTLAMETINDNLLFRADVALLSLLFLDLDGEFKKGIYREALISFLQDHADRDSVRQTELFSAKTTLAELIHEMMSKLQDNRMKDFQEWIGSLHELLDQLNAASSMEKLKSIMQNFSEKITKAKNGLDSGVLNFFTESVKALNISDEAKKTFEEIITSGGKHFAWVDNAFEIAVKTTEIVKDVQNIALVSADTERCVEIHNMLQRIARDAGNVQMRLAAMEVLGALDSGYGEVWASCAVICENELEFGVEKLLELLAKECPYVAAAVFVRDAFALFDPNIKDNLKSICKMDMYLHMSNALCAGAQEITGLYGISDFVYIDETKLTSFLQNIYCLANARILGEEAVNKWIDLGEDLPNQIAKIKTCAKNIGASV